MVKTIVAARIDVVGVVDIGFVAAVPLYIAEPLVDMPQSVFECINTYVLFIYMYINIYVLFLHKSTLHHIGRRGGLGSRPRKMYGERLGDGVEYHSMKPRSHR